MKIRALNDDAIIGKKPLLIEWEINREPRFQL